MRLGHFVVVLYVIYIVIGIIDQVMSPTLQMYGNGASGVFLAALTQPWVWQNNSLLLLLGGAVVAGAAIAAGTSFFSRSDISSLSALATAFFALEVIPLVGLYDFVSRNVGMYACSAGGACGEANIIGGLTVGVIGVMYLFTVLEWWMWRPTTQ